MRGMKLPGMAFVLSLVLVLGLGCNSHHGNAASPDAPAGPTFACGSTTCSTSQYCYQFHAGVQPADPNVGCNDMPAACAAAPSCACLVANSGSPCGTGATCSEQDGGFTVTCLGI